jgi:hypothetical protein
VGLLVFGSTGYLVGTTAGSRAEPEPAAADAGPATAEASPAASAPAPLPPFEANQLAFNRRKVGAVLVPLAESWLPWVGGCVTSSEAGGPRPEAGEQSRVFCELSNLDVYFIQYRSVSDRDRARAARQAQNGDASRLAPGAAPVAAGRAGTSRRTSGAYVEFAYRDGGRTISGVWWDDAGTATAAYVETPWTDGTGWRPLRDIWQRYS